MTAVGARWRGADMGWSFNVRAGRGVSIMVKAADHQRK